MSDCVLDLVSIDNGSATMRTHSWLLLNLADGRIGIR